MLSRLLKYFNKLKPITKLLPIILLLTIVLYDIPINESWSTWTLPLSGNIIIIDPGHGGKDGGASSESGIVEKEITLKISEYLRDYLNQAGAYVIMTRETDKDLADENRLSTRKLADLKNRINLANKSMADFFISIHLNSTTSEQWRGAQTFYYPVRQENKLIAENIQEQLIINLQNTDRKSLPRTNILVLKYLEMPSVIVEVGFLSNQEEAQLLSETNYQKKVAYAIYQGILSYYSERDNLINEN